MNSMVPFLRFFLLFLTLQLCEARYFSTVIIDPGHGGRDGGAYWGGIKESTLNLKVAQRLAVELKSRGIKTVLTRNSNVTASKGYRTRLANKYPNSVFVSVHFNAHTNTSIKGIETFYASAEGRKLASLIQKGLIKNLKTSNRGVKLKGYQVLMQTNAPAVLVECGFISNPSERARCATKWYQITAARVIADSLMTYRKMR